MELIKHVYREKKKKKGRKETNSLILLNHTNISHGIRTKSNSFLSRSTVETLYHGIYAIKTSNPGYYDRG